MVKQVVVIDKFYVLQIKVTSEPSLFTSTFDFVGNVVEHHTKNNKNELG